MRVETDYNLIVIVDLFDSIFFQMVCWIWIIAYLVLAIALYQSISHDLLTLGSGLITVFSVLIGRCTHDHLTSTDSIGWRLLVVGFVICTTGFMTLYVSFMG